MQQADRPDPLQTFLDAANAKVASDDCLAGVLREQSWAAKAIYAAFRRYDEGSTGLPIPVRAARVEEAARCGSSSAGLPHAGNLDERPGDEVAYVAVVLA